MMNRETWFTVQSHGYEVPADGFGMTGMRLTPVRGKTLTIEVKRTILAKRLGRITGAGSLPRAKNLAKTATERVGHRRCRLRTKYVYRGKLYWAWGDTTLAKYPLGIFDGTSATTALQPLKVSSRHTLQLDYVVDTKNQPRGVCKMPGSARRGSRVT